MYTWGNEIEYKFELKSPKDDSLLGDFDCGNEIINKYLNSQCKDDISNITYLVKDKKQNKVIGFASICCSSIRLKHESISESYPAIEIKYFAIASNIQKLVYDDDDEHFYFSDRLLCDIFILCREISEKTLGALYILLYSVPSAINFYTRNYFQNFSEYMLKDNTSFLDGCSPMFMSL